MTGEIAPGALLRQEKLSEQFGVSRTPIREALRRLAALGLVSFVPNRGVRVRTLDRDDLREAFLVRAELESLATELATPRITAEQLAELEVIERRFSELTNALRKGDRDQAGDWMRTNHAFHDVIYAAADAPLVERMAKSARRAFMGQAAWGVGSDIDDALRPQRARAPGDPRGTGGPLARGREGAGADARPALGRPAARDPRADGEPQRRREADAGAATALAVALFDRGQLGEIPLDARGELVALVLQELELRLAPRSLALLA